MMTIQRIPGEMRWWVSSESRDVDHVVDMDWREEKWHRPRIMCGCEEMQAKEKPFCKHGIAAAQVACEQAGFMVLANGKGIWLRK